ncbi:hypothetical protein GDO78_000783 [Eleutherodactylus coqui]|uniref:Uncharacterized protein n=1 Tax=Eleutherodactylus coqui TaxID=57060 RepID=A0A8J6FRG7_ELECQ|nr:hypothetical protein GDO78_000783 [Eleutherodactylus coqui]
MASPRAAAIHRFGVSSSPPQPVYVSPLRCTFVLGGCSRCGKDLRGALGHLFPGWLTVEAPRGAHCSLPGAAVEHRSRRRWSR